MSMLVWRNVLIIQTSVFEVKHLQQTECVDALAECALYKQASLCSKAEHTCIAGSAVLLSYRCI